MTKKQVLEYLQISNQTLYRLMKAHELPYVKLVSGKRGTVRFRRADIDAWLRARVVK